MRKEAFEVLSDFFLKSRVKLCTYDIYIYIYNRHTYLSIIYYLHVRIVHINICMSLRYPGISMKLLYFPRSIWLQGMDWGHAPGCVCVVCATLPRIHRLIAENSKRPGVVPFIGARLRLLESEVRDDLVKFSGSQGSSDTPNLQGEKPGNPAYPGLPSHFPGFAPPLPGLFVPPPAARAVPPPPPLHPCGPSPEPPQPGSYPKGKPVTPGTSSSASVPVKAEQSEASRSLEPVGELQAEEPEEKVRKKKDKKEKEKRKKSRSRSKRKSHPREGERSLSRKKKRSRTPEAKGERGSPRAGVERAEGGQRERSAEPDRRSRSERSRKPREPNYPPNQKGGGKGRKGKGIGWRGVIPYSDHPRWSESKNKGITKRAKQERFARKGGRY